MTQDPSTELDVAVIGGGVVGLAIAWRAAQRGRRVAVFDSGPIAGGASHVAAGMLAPAAEAEFGRAGRHALELGMASATRWPGFAAELAEASGVETVLRRSGTLMVARDRDEAEALERERAWREELGLGVTRLRGSEARALEPALAPRVRLALELPDDHSVDPRPLLGALAAAAEKEGVELRPGTPVRGACVTGGAVTGVELADGGVVAARTVVVAAGAWSGSLGGIPAQDALPVRPVKGQILRLRDPSGPGLLERVLRYEGGYVVPRDDGGYVVGASVEERGFDQSVTAGGVYELLRDAQEIVPGIAELELEECSAGLRPALPDNLPAIGRAKTQGLVWATGHHRNGILLAPLTAALAVAAIEGEPVSTLHELCAPGRFAARVTA